MFSKRIRVFRGPRRIPDPIATPSFGPSTSIPPVSRDSISQSRLYRVPSESKEVLTIPLTARRDKSISRARNSKKFPRPVSAIPFSCKSQPTCLHFYRFAKKPQALSLKTFASRRERMNIYGISSSPFCSPLLVSMKSKEHRDHCNMIAISRGTPSRGLHEILPSLSINNAPNHGLRFS